MQQPGGLEYGKPLALSRMKPAFRSPGAALRASAAQRRRQPSEPGLKAGQVTPLRAAAHGFSKPGLSVSLSQPALGSERAPTPAASVKSYRPTTSLSVASVRTSTKPNGRPTTSLSVPDSCASTEVDELALSFFHLTGKDPIIESMMRGPPIYSATLSSIASMRGFA
eukprot:TRINITY_DN23707_c0_g1_i1.p1 TRINITY_DN23707_c0_g1~~TRINITY_DN23707_c0_g1_i1.p1  ORF type:complete len:167 (-),score=15.83 TRINITY_DN23707_c0_g1_i1:180-680(-)